MCENSHGGPLYDTAMIICEGVKAGALCDNAIIKCKGSIKNLWYVVVIGCDTMEFLLYLV